MTTASPLPVPVRTPRPARTLLAVPLAGALAAVVVSWPAPALAADPPALPGEEVEASTDLGAPTDLAPGTWSFEVGSPEEPRWFRLRRTIPGSTMHVSVVAPAAPDDGLSLAVSTPDETPCTSDTGSAPYSWGPLMEVGIVVGPGIVADADAGSAEPEEDAEEAPCVTARTLLLAVGRSSLVEESGDLPVMLRVVEEAPVETLEGLRVPDRAPTFRAPDVTGDASEAEAATGFVDVPEVGTGIYRGSVASGRAAVRRISLGWGQRALVRLISPKVPEAVAEDFEDGLPGLRLTARDPLLAEIGVEEPLLGSASVTSAEMVVGPVAYLGRAATPTGPSLPGDHFLVVELQDGAGDLEVDYTLQVEVVGEASDGPAYAEDEPFVLGEDETSRMVQYDGGRGPLRLITAGALAVLGAGSLGAGVLLLRRR